MTILVLTCIEVSEREGYYVVTFTTSSSDSAIYASGNIGFTIADGSQFEVGKNYDLNLNEVSLA